MSVTTGSAVVTLPAENQILITREFDAPAPLVWRAMTEPDLIRRWWHANRGEVLSCEVDLRVGGRWRYVSRTHEGFEFAFHGEYREIVPGERIVTTEAYEGIPDADANAAVNTVTLEEREGRTVMTVLVEHPTREGRDAHVGSGMEAGMQTAYDLLEEVAVSLRPR